MSTISPQARQELVTAVTVDSICPDVVGSRGRRVGSASIR